MYADKCVRTELKLVSAHIIMLESRFKHCTKDVSMFTAQPTILELELKHNHVNWSHEFCSVPSDSKLY